MKYSLLLYKYQVQNTANAAPRRVDDTSAAPSTHRKRHAAARQQEYSRLSEQKRKKKEKKKNAFSAALDARQRCEIGRVAGRRAGAGVGVHIENNRGGCFDACRSAD